MKNKLTTSIAALLLAGAGLGVRAADLLDDVKARGVLHSDAQGRFGFRSVLPVAYPIPTDGPVGQMLVASGRHPWRPAHVHFMIAAPGFETLVTHVFRAGDPYLDSDVVFGVRASLIADFVAHAPRTGPHAKRVEGRYHTLAFTFVLQAQLVQA